MRHIIYKTTHINGKYYIGRHSTENIDDGYLGSGIWVRDIKDKSTLTRKIIKEVDTVEELIAAEEEYLLEHFGHVQCMNMNSSSTGAPVGELNPMKNPATKAKFQGKNHWSFKDPNSSEKLREAAMKLVAEDKHPFQGDRNPMHDPKNKKIIGALTRKRNLTNNPSTKLAAEGKHHWQHGKAPNYKGKLNKKLIAEGRHNFGSEHSARMVAEGKNAWSGPEGNRKMLAEGKHPSQIKITCEYCGKEISKGMYVRWHGDNCKQK